MDFLTFGPEEGDRTTGSYPASWQCLGEQASQQILPLDLKHLHCFFFKLQTNDLHSVPIILYRFSLARDRLLKARI